MTKHLLLWVVILMLAAPIQAANVFTEDPNCKLVMRFEKADLDDDAMDNHATISTTGSPAADETDYAEGSASCYFATAGSDYFSITDADLCAGFPFKNGDTTKKISVCFWLYLPTADDLALNSSRYLWEKGIDGKFSIRLAMRRDSTGRFFIFSAFADGAWRSMYLIAATGYDLPKIALDTWHHVTVTYDAVNRVLGCDLWNGTSTTSASETFPTSEYTTQVSNGPFKIAQTWQGNLDEFCVFNDLLSSEDANQIRQGVYGASANTYYCDINQEVNGDGSIGSPWNSIANASIGIDALDDDGAGDTLVLIAGTYDAFADNSVWEKPRTDWLTIQPYTGDEVIIATPKPVEILRSSLDSIKLKFVGLRLIPTNPDPLPKDTHDSKNYTANRVTANIANCQDVTFQDCEIKGLPYRWLTHTVVNIYACKSVLVTGCKVHHAAWVLISATHGCCDVTIQGNVLWDDGLGEWLKFEGPNTGQIIVERNLMIDSQSPYYLVSPRNANEPYSPYLAVNSTEYHPGSGIVIKSDKAGPTWDRFIIRKNIMDGPSNTSMVQHLYTYEQWGGYDSMTIENNLFIECTDARFHDLYCADADHSVLIRNNTCAGPATHNILSRGYLPTRYCDSYNVCTTSSGASSYQYIYSYNNLWVAQGSASPGATKDTFTSNNNLLWCPYNFSTIPAWKGANDIFMFYYTTSFHGNPNGFGDIGWTNANNAGSPTPEYDSTKDPVADIFTDWDHLNYTLSGNTFWYSSARDPLTFGDASLDPDDSLGTVDANGFILDDGPARDASHHAVGCYEAGATFGHPTRPSLPNPFNQEFDVAVDPNLSWYRGLAAVSYNVYYGTDQKKVAARDASTKRSTKQTGTAYGPLSLSGSTTYYWAVDSVGSDDSIGNGVVWEFTTEESPPSPSSARISGSRVGRTLRD